MTKEIVFTFDGNDIQAELGKGFPPGATAEKEAEKYLKGIAVKEKVGAAFPDIAEERGS